MKKSLVFLSRNDVLITNIYVFNPVTESGYYLFPEDHNNHIISLTFETQVKDGVVQFHNEYSSPVKNNSGVENRKPKSTMLVVTKNLKKKVKTFFIADKEKGKPQKIGQIPADQDWHLDVRNSKIRIVSQVGKKIKIETLAW